MSPGRIVYGGLPKRNCLYMRGNPRVLDARYVAATFPHCPKFPG